MNEYIESVPGHIEVNEDNVQGVLLASTFLQCFRAERVAADFILTNLVPANAFSIFLLAINCGSTYLVTVTIFTLFLYVISG